MPMKYPHAITRLPWLLACAWLLHGCAEMPANAPIDDRTGAREKPKSTAAVKSAPIAVAVATEPADPPGFYTVKKGDTLGKLARQFGQSVRDLSEWNRLSDPNDIRVGRQLRVIPPEDNRVASVPTDTGMELRTLDTAGNGNTGNTAGGANAATAAPATDTVTPSSAVAARAAGGTKNGPLGQKVAYSDQAWADMQRGEPAKFLGDPRRPPSVGAPALGRFIWPTEGKVIRTFDASRKGIDIAGQPGQPIVAVGEGTVLYANNMRGFGNLVIIDHRDGLVSAYGHNKNIVVKEGQTVTKGQRIAEMGDVDAESVRLHFEIRQLGKAVDPMGFLPSR